MPVAAGVEEWLVGQVVVGLPVVPEAAEVLVGLEVEVEPVVPAGVVERG